jgi:hypothetical protein
VKGIQQSEEVDSMPKAAIVVLADTEDHEDLARVTNALVTAKEFKEAADDVTLIFDGAGTKWPGELSEGHPAHGLYEDLKDTIGGACAFCAHAFHAEGDNHDAEVPLLDEYRQHPSLRKLVARGYEVLTF